jgi:hypothetical protein
VEIKLLKGVNPKRRRSERCVRVPLELKCYAAPIAFEAVRFFCFQLLTPLWEDPPLASAPHWHLDISATPRGEKRQRIAIEMDLPHWTPQNPTVSWLIVVTLSKERLNSLPKDATPKREREAKRVGG